MGKVKTHYDNLKVSKTAPQEVIRAAYKALSQKYHPDRNDGNPDANRVMKIINEAYNVLSDPLKRKEHDLWIEEQEKNTDSETCWNSNNNLKEQERRKAERKAQEDSLRNYTDAERKNKQFKTNSFKLIAVLTVVLIIPIIILIKMKNNSNKNYNLYSNYTDDQILEVPQSENNSFSDDKILNKTYAASFDCNKAKSITENLICNNEELSIADIENSNLLKSASLVVTDKKAFRERVRKQWNYREKNCKDEACLYDWYNYQKSIFSQIIQTGEVNAGLNIKELNPEPLPETGFNDNNQLEGIAPLQIKIPSTGNHYYVKIEDVYSRKTLIHYFIRSGSELNVNLPLGTYNIKYAYGRKWYGNKLLFGPQTSYAKADQTFNFKTDGYNYNGFTVELIEQVNGNLKTSHIEDNEF